MAKVPELPSPAAMLGTRVHAEIDEWFKGNRDRDAVDPIAEEALNYLDTIRHYTNTEVPIAHEIVGIPVKGRIDVLSWHGEYGEILDWKTTSRVPPRPDLLSTVQMPMYAMAAGEQWLDKVHLTHFYLQTRTPWRHKVHTELVTRDQVTERWVEISVVAAAIPEVAKVTDPSYIEPNYAACGVGRGCPYRAICPTDPISVAFPTQEVVPVSSLLSKLPGYAAATFQQAQAERRPTVNPPDAPASGVTAPAADSIPAEVVAALPPAVRAAVEAKGGVAQPKPKRTRTTALPAKGIRISYEAKINVPTTFGAGNFETRTLRVEFDPPAGSSLQEAMESVFSEIEAAARNLRG